MTLREKDIFYLAGLIVDSLKGNLDEARRGELDRWLQTSAKNREMYARFSSREVMEEKVAERLFLGGKEDQARFRMVYRQRQNRLLIRRFLRYAAGVALLFVTSISAWYLLREEVPVMSIVQMDAQGKGKAILTLAGGEQVILNDSLHEPLQERGGVQLNVGSGGVTYVYPEDSTVVSGKDDVVYNTLRVPRGGEYILTLSDGTRVWINAESEIRYPVKFSGHERVVYLEGEAFFEVTHDKKMPFVVVAENTSVRVLGTQFNTRAYPEEKVVQTTLVSGSVVLHSNKKEQEIRLVPGEQGTVDLTDGSLSHERVETYFYTGWKEGRLVFRDTRMVDLLEVLARWYDLKVFYMNMEAKDIRFTGDLDKSADFDKILKIIEGNGRVCFTVDGRTVTVRVK